MATATPRGSSYNPQERGGRGHRDDAAVWEHYQSPISAFAIVFRRAGIDPSKPESPKYGSGLLRPKKQIKSFGIVYIGIVKVVDRNACLR
ncbi:MAG TPA: hypothetical protein VFE47_22575 [Tepidisphaeraceae bacterium]|jgi:hypothetical protein|nr:hypothetical protein [Tepidisphaeraceae bacterium]